MSSILNRLQSSNQPVAIMFHWNQCGWCKRVMPAFQAAKRRLKPKGVRCMLIEATGYQNDMPLNRAIPGINSFPQFYVFSNGRPQKMRALSATSTASEIYNAYAKFAAA